MTVAVVGAVALLLSQVRVPHGKIVAVHTTALEAEHSETVAVPTITLGADLPHFNKIFVPEGPA
jgi:hypothetical protein